MIQLNDSLEKLSGVGKETVNKLKSVGIISVEDLFNYWPRRYDDYSNVVNIKDSKPGPLTIVGKFSRVKSRYSRKGLHLTEALASDETGSVSVVWFNQFYRSANIKLDTTYYISGNFDVQSGRLCLVNPSIIESENEGKNNLIQAIYPENKLINSNLLRRLIKKTESLFTGIQETLPNSILQNENLTSRSEAVHLLHLPKSMDDLNKAKERLIFEELFQIQLASELLKKEINREKSPTIIFDNNYVKNLLKKLPYSLTDDQKLCLWQIFQDIEKNHPMNRLIEGDVGSGKTIVSALAAMVAIHNGYQVILMAPTEILARQHEKTFVELFKTMNLEKTITLLVGSQKKPDKQSIYNELKNGDKKMIIGTHALIQDKVITKNVGLVIIDEQHRFGVNQRQLLRGKGGIFPHFLSLTATPIPRTLALTLYGELDISLIKSKPKNRKQTLTSIHPFSARHGLYQKVSDLINEGNQVFIVCPLIDESELLQVNSVLKLYEEISKKQLRNHRISFLHGKMKPKEKDDIMESFRQGEIDVLVSTTVIEVGVDVSNANVMVIEGAERFGLAQVHQLRGRVGRGGGQGYCFLIPSQDVGETKRLRALESTDDGFKLAELDLELRGPGSIYGVRQSGLLDLRIATLNDRDMILRAKKAALYFINSEVSMVEYKELESRVKHFQSLTKLN